MMPAKKRNCPQVRRPLAAHATFGQRRFLHDAVNQRIADGFDFVGDRAQEAGTPGAGQIAKFGKRGRGQFHRSFRSASLAA